MYYLTKSFLFFKILNQKGKEKSLKGKKRNRFCDAGRHDKIEACKAKAFKKGQ